MAASATPPQRHDRHARLTGWTGIGFVVLLLVSAGMATVPGGGDSVGSVRQFYSDNAGVVATAQVLGLLAAAVFAVFAGLLAGVAWVRSPTAVRLSGWGVAGAAALTAVPVLWLCLVAESGSDSLVHRLAVGSDLTDVLLFAAVAAFAACLARGAADTWLRVLGWAVAALALGRSVLLLAGADALELIAPLAFIVLVLAAGVRSLLRPRPGPD